MTDTVYAWDTPLAPSLWDSGDARADIMARVVGHSVHALLTRVALDSPDTVPDIGSLTLQVLIPDERLADEYDVPILHAEITVPA